MTFTIFKFFMRETHSAVCHNYLTDFNTRTLTGPVGFATVKSAAFGFAMVGKTNHLN